MSRLIDADEFINELEDLYHRVGWGERDVHFSLADIKCNIDMMPTVEAIPVEFIKSEIKENKGFYNSNLRRLLDVWAERKEE